jgi:hypothetical protein
VKICRKEVFGQLLFPVGKTGHVSSYKGQKRHNDGVRYKFFEKIELIPCSDCACFGLMALRLVIALIFNFNSSNF